VIIPPLQEIEIINRPKIKKGDMPPDKYRIYQDVYPGNGNDPVSPMATAGEG
jgi:hypothetical protein